jgi:hypothetical protein
MFTCCRAVRLVPVVVAFLVLCGLTPLSATVINPNSYFTFIGDCEDCTGQGVGYLVLQNYTLGDPLDISNFVSFSYSSNLMTLMLSGAGSGPGQVSDFSGSLPGQLPSFTDMSISSEGVQVFGPASSGSWCVGINGCNLDFGVNGVFVIGVPEPASLALTFTGFAGLMLMGLRRRRIRDNANG